MALTFDEDMNSREWQSLSEIDQIDRCQELSPYTDENLMDAVKQNWIETFGQKTGITDLHIGWGPGVGPFNCIVLQVPDDRKKLRLPAYFMGFPLLRRYINGRVYIPNLSKYAEKLRTSNQTAHPTTPRRLSTKAHHD